MFWIILAAMLIFSGCGKDIVMTPKLQYSSPVPVRVQAKEKPETGEDVYKSVNFDTVKAVWISYLELSKIVTAGDKQFRNEFSDMCDNCSSLGINTLYVHVRTFGDAFYPSKYYPSTKAFCGNVFDALEIMVEEAHKRGLSFHAWINPLRCESEEYIENISDEYLIKKWYDDPDEFPDYIVGVEETGHYWLDPAVKEVRQLICDGVYEIVDRYDVDGIHIDDYFYPTVQPSFDSKQYNLSGTELPLNDWRFENCSEMVKGIYSAVKKANKTVEFSVSPQGNVYNNYNYLFADVRRWCSEEGYCDCIVPQIYYGYENVIKTFDETINEWKEFSGCKKLVIGIGAYKIETVDEFINETGIIARQGRLALENADGIALFSYASLFENDRGKEECDELAKLLK